ncbi:MAG: hypothetical protein F6K24_31905 [Okeania sp. SIO2D1]|nr:hypothetical protein [Okeania sp. SIO2D1]
MNLILEEGRRKKAEDRRQKTEDRRQKAEGRRQKAEGRRENCLSIQTPNNFKHPLDGGVLNPLQIKIILISLALSNF